MTNLISIITPSFNNDRFIRSCLASVKNQTYRNHEHLVIDGGSTDNTKEILATEKSIISISEPDNGMYDAINKGIRLSKGGIIAYLNADDAYYPHTLETIANIFAHHPEVDFVFGNLTLVDEQLNTLYQTKPVPFNKLLTCSNRITWGQPSCFWRKTVHERIGYFDSHFKNFGDNEFFLRMLSHGLRGQYVNQYLAKFMLRSDCITNKNKQNAINEKARIQKTYNRKIFTAANIVNEAVFLMRNLSSVPARLYFKLYRKWI